MVDEKLPLYGRPIEKSISNIQRFRAETMQGILQVVNLPRNSQLIPVRCSAPLDSWIILSAQATPL